ncbi:MAG: 30S ribosomal protein S20 [Candidatus Omnitrophica bacterium]|nr:30S ribosomal protein S20 [Candidatus Omnitrophota bacterium]
MPNKKSAIKRLRQDKKKHDRNKAILSEIRTFAKKAKAAIADKDAVGADDTLKTLESKLTRAARKDIIKKNTASRKVSRLRSQWSKIETQA